MEWTDNEDGTLDLTTIVAVSVRLIIDKKMGGQAELRRPLDHCASAQHRGRGLRGAPMSRYRDQTGAALIMLIGVTAVLALLSATLVLAIQNQQAATAHERVEYAVVLRRRGGARLRCAVRQGGPDDVHHRRVADARLNCQTAFAGSLPGRRGRDLQGVRQPRDGRLRRQVGPGRPDRRHHARRHRVWVEATVDLPGRERQDDAHALPDRADLGAVRRGAAQGRDVQRHRHPTATTPATSTPSTRDRPADQHVGDRLPDRHLGRRDVDPGARLPSWAEVGRFRSNWTSDLGSGVLDQSLAIAVNGSVARQFSPGSPRLGR